MRVKFFWKVNGVCNKCSKVKQNEEELPDDITKEELDKLAQEYYENDMEPEWWWEKVDK